MVVIAIIALLLSVIMPALGKAKTYAQELVCSTNIRQYGLATEIYCNENKDMVPDAWESLYSKIKFNDESIRSCRWHNPKYDLQSGGRDTDGTPYAGPYWPYLAATKANICPVFAKLAPKYGRSHNGSCIGEPFIPQFSYSMNARIFGNGRVKRSQVKSPSQTFLWAEENMWKLTGLSNYVLNDNALLVGNPNNNQVIDNLSSFHKISKGKLAIQRDTRKYESNTGVSNVLMVDGSIRWLTPEQGKKFVGEIR